MNELKCVMCDSEDCDLQSLKLPVRGEMRSVGVVFCCDKCKESLNLEIAEYARMMELALDALDILDGEKTIHE
jgi:hypothetical protein